MKTWTTSKVRETKGRQKLVCLTAYDYSTARIMDEAGVHLVLVGDSLAMTMLGYENTLPVTMNEMLHHTAAVARAVKQALVVGDMPFMSYQVSSEQAVRNGGRFLQEAGAAAVKIEGGAFRVPTVEALVRNGIPVLGHIGLTPQSIRQLGGFKVQGKQPQEFQRLLDDATALEQAGAFALVLECVPAKLGREITSAVGIPTIGIGAGDGCDGQILVSHDLLGIHTGVTPRFVKQYAQIEATMRDAFKAYKQDVEGGSFPTEEHAY